MSTATRNARGTCQICAESTRNFWLRLSLQSNEGAATSRRRHRSSRSHRQRRRRSRPRTRNRRPVPVRTPRLVAQHLQPTRTNPQIRTARDVRGNGLARLLLAVALVIMRQPVARPYLRFQLVANRPSRRNRNSASTATTISSWSKSSARAVLAR